MAARLEDALKLAGVQADDAQRQVREGAVAQDQVELAVAQRQREAVVEVDLDALVAGEVVVEEVYFPRRVLDQVQLTVRQAGGDVAGVAAGTRSQLADLHPRLEVGKGGFFEDRQTLSPAGF